MKKEDVRFAVIINGSWIGYLCNDMGEVEDAIRDYAEDMVDGEQAIQKAKITVLPVVGEPLEKNTHFMMEVERGDAEFESVDYSYDEEPDTFHIEETGSRHDSLYEVQEYLKDLVRDGDYTVDEIRAFTITGTCAVSVEFEHAVEGEIEVHITLTENGNDVLGALEPVQVIEETTLEAVKAEALAQPKPLSEMTDDELYKAHNEAIERMALVTYETHERSKARAVQPYRVVTSATLSEDMTLGEDEDENTDTFE